jgi:uncharacterized protein (DUF2252 family)
MNRRLFHVHEVARCIAGVGSLGLERYTALVDGRGKIDGHFLLDLKVQPGSSLVPYLPLLPLPNEAERVVAVQSRAQAVASAFVSAVACEGMSCVLRELMPSSDSLQLKQWNGKLSRLEPPAQRQLDDARSYASQVKQDWQAFSEADQSGFGG